MADLTIEGAGGVTLRGDDTGEGTPVVLLHGLTATRRYVVHGSRMLERGGHRVIAYDARGHGASAPAPAPDAYGYPDLLADLLAVLDACDIERAVLAGASMGAHTIVRAAVEHPDRVAALALVTPAYEPGQEHDAGRLQHWDALAGGLRDGGVEGFVEAYGRPSVPEQWLETVDRVIRQRLAAHEHPAAVADALTAVPRSAAFGSWEDLGRIGAPAVVVASRDEADPEHPYATGERYAEAIPGARLVSEDPGSSPLAWQGGQLSRVIAELAEHAAV